MRNHDWNRLESPLWGVMISPQGTPIDFRLKFIGARLCHSKKITIGKRRPPKNIFHQAVLSMFQELILSQNGQISEMEVALVALVEDLETALDLYLSRIGSFWMGLFFWIDHVCCAKTGPLSSCHWGYKSI